MKTLCFFLLLLLAFPLLASAQSVELSGGYAHISGDGGLDGFNLGAGLWVTRRVSLNFDYDSGWDTSHLGAFALTQTGLIVTKSRLQDFLAGPRVTFPGILKDKKTNIPRLWPFGEVQVGSSHLNSRLEDPTTNLSQEASDNAFSWLIGAGADYRLSPHWVSRLKVGFLRTHFADTGQSRLRLGIGVAYTFGERGAKEAAAAKRKADAELAASDVPTKAAEDFDAEKQALRARLLEHFNRVLPTTDTPRGLVVNMGDVLFETAKSDLRPEAREDLAKLAGILLNYPSLRLAIEGYTDNTGDAEFNRTLSEQRANAVRDYLVKEGLNADSLSVQGYGMDHPVADNTTAEGRQKNRRTEIIVSGQVIGTQIGHKP